MLATLLALMLAMQAGARIDAALALEAKGDAQGAVAEARAAVAAKASPTDAARANALLGRLLAADQPDAALPLLDAALPALPDKSFARAEAQGFRLVADCGANGFVKCLDPLESVATALVATPSAGVERERAAYLLSSFATFAQVRGRRALADDLLAKALALLDGPADRAGSFAAATLANAAYQVTRTSEHDRAIGYLDRAIAILGRVRGTAHADLVDPLSLLGEAQMRAGRYDAAGEALRRAVAIADAAPGVSPTAHVLALTTLGGFYAQTNRRDQGLALFERAVAVGEADAAVARQMAGVYRNVASLYVEVGNWDRAGALLGKALTNAQGAAGKASSAYGGALLDIADLELKRGNLDAAAKAAGEVRAIFATAIEPANARNGDPIAIQANVAQRRGDAAAAAKLYDDALKAMAARASSSVALIDAQVGAGEAWSAAEPASLRGYALARRGAEAMTARLVREAQLAGVGAQTTVAQRPLYDSTLAVAWDARGRALR